MVCGVSLCCQEESSVVQAVVDMLTQMSSPFSLEEFTRSHAVAVLPFFMVHTQKITGQHNV